MGFQPQLENDVTTGKIVALLIQMCCTEAYMASAVLVPPIISPFLAHAGQALLPLLSLQSVDDKNARSSLVAFLSAQSVMSSDGTIG